MSALPSRLDASEPETWTQEGASRLRDRIEAFWRAKGSAVHVYLVSAGFHSAVRGNRVDVRSDMIDGLPRRSRT